MTFKKTKIISVAVAVVLLFVFVFAACESFSQKKIPGGTPESVVESNGGYAVKQGDWLYFINGKTGFPDGTDLKANYFGKVRKGAIVRVALDSNGEPVMKNADGNALTGDYKESDIDYEETYKVIVPKNVYSTAKAGGFSIFGEWIYYATPTTETDNQSKLQTDNLDYYRTKIDGRDTQSITPNSIKGQSLEYKFTSTGFIWFADNTLYSVPYDNKSVGKQITLAEDVTSKLMPSSSTYDPSATGTDMTELVYYTVNYANDENKAGLPGNELFAVSADKKINKKLISITDYTGGEEPSISNKDKLMTITLGNFRASKNEIEIYYQKAHSVGGTQSVTLGIYGNLIYMENGELKINLADERRYTRAAESNTYLPMGLDEGILVFKTPATLEKPKSDKIAEDERNRDTETYKSLTATSILFFADHTQKDPEGNDVTSTFVYYQNGSSVVRAPLDPLKGYPETLVTGIDTSFFNLDIVGNYCYYISTDTANNFSYLVRAHLTNPKYNEDTNNPTDKLLAYMTTEDKKSWDDLQD